MFEEVVEFIKTLYPCRDIIPLHEPRFRGNEKRYLIECIDSTFVSSVGKFVDAFEKKIEEYTEAKKAVVIVNGTEALHFALKLVGVAHDDEVITQPLTFIATNKNYLFFTNSHITLLGIFTSRSSIHSALLKSPFKDF